MAKPLFLSDARFPAACPSYSPPMVLGGGYVSDYSKKAKELGLVRIRVDVEKYPVKNFISITK